MFVSLQLLGMLAGAVVGGLLGFRFQGLYGAVVGGFLGGWAGGFVGRLPYAFAIFWMKREMDKGDVATLEARLEKEFYLSHHLLAQLAARGAPMERYEGYVLSLLRSDPSDKRSFGWTNLQTWYPALAQKLGTFDPNAPTEECRRRLEVLSPRLTLKPSS
jgi:hypothetical protein